MNVNVTPAWVHTGVKASLGGCVCKMIQEDGSRVHTG